MREVQRLGQEIEQSKEIEMRQALELALEALIGARAFLESDAPVEIWDVNDKAISAIKEALAQPEQEPVAWLCKRKDGHFDVLTDQTCTKCFPVYAHPPSVTWGDQIGGIGFNEPMPNANYKVIATIAPHRARGQA